MSISLESISKAAAVRAPRIILLGTEKVGKSTFASQAPKPIVMPIRGEEGTDGLGVDQFPTLRAYGDVMAALGVLYTDQHEYETVVIDSGSTLEPLIWDETCRVNDADSIEKVGGGYGKGYTESLRYWRELTDGLDALRNDRNMASIIIGHVTVTKFNDPTTDAYDVFSFDINRKAADLLMRWADVVLFATRKAMVRKEDIGFKKTKARAVGDDARVLLTQKRPAHPGGGRNVYGRLPYELPLSWAAFQEAVAKATAPAAA